MLSNVTLVFVCVFHLYEGHRLLPYFLLIALIITNAQLSYMKSPTIYLIDEILFDVFPRKKEDL